MITGELGSMRKLLLMITGIMTAAMLAGCTTKEDEGEVSLFNKKMIVGTDIAFDDITDLKITVENVLALTGLPFEGSVNIIVMLEPAEKQKQVVGLHPVFLQHALRGIRLSKAAPPFGGSGIGSSVQIRV